MRNPFLFKRHIKNNPFQKKEIRFYYNGAKQWWLNGKLHREDGPAIESNGTKQWWLNGKRHREDGPAIEWNDGSKQWYLNNKRFLSEIEYLKAAKEYKKKHKLP